MHAYLFVSEHDFSCGRHHIDSGVHLVDVSAVVVWKGVFESPRGPVLNIEQAADAVVFQAVVLQVLQAGPVQWKAIVYHSAIG